MMDIVIESNSGETLKMPREHAELSVTLQNMLDVSTIDDKSQAVPLPFSSEILLQLNKWMKLFCEAKKACNPGESPAAGMQWERSLFGSVGRTVLLGLLEAANFLAIRPLLDSASTYIADVLSGKSAKEVRDYLGIKDDFGEEERKVMNEKYQWLQNCS